MGEARAKAAGEMGGPIRFGKKMGVSVGGAAPKGRAVPWGDWRKGASKEVEAMVEGERNGEGWSGVARGHCWEAREQGGVGVGLGCPKAAVTLKDEDTGGTAGEEKQKKKRRGVKEEREGKKQVSYTAQLSTTRLTQETLEF